MLETKAKRTFLPQSTMKLRVPRLRDSELPGQVKIYKALPDGKPGKLLRVERAE